MRISTLVILLTFLFSANTIAADYVKIADIQKINLSDTFEQVIEKIGAPNEIVSKELTDDGKVKQVCLYFSAPPIDAEKLSKEEVDIPRTMKGPFSALSDLVKGKGYNPLAPWKEPVGVARATWAKDKFEKEHPPYLITFTDGKVSSIKRQQ